MLITTRPYAFSAPSTVRLPEGLTLRTMVNEVYTKAGVPQAWQADAIVLLDGVPIPNKLWDCTVPLAGANVVITTALHGGGGGGSKNPFRVLLTVAVVVVAFVYGPMLGTFAAEGLGFTTATALATGGVALTTAGTVAAALGSAAITFAGMALVNAIAPIRPPALPSFSGGSAARVGGGGGAAASPTYSISGATNSFRHFGTVPVVLGTHKHIPPCGALSYTEILGNDEYIRMLVVWGYGPLEITNLKIGENPISIYDNVEIETVEGWASDSALTLFPGSVFQDQIGVTLREVDNATVRNSRAEADELSIDLIFPRGLVNILGDGTVDSLTVSVVIKYRLVGAGAWTTLPTLDIGRATQTVVRVGHRWTVTKGQYEVSVERTTADRPAANIADLVVWSTLRTFVNTPPINFRQPLAMTALRIKASEQLSGAIQDLSATVTSYANIWDGVDWDTIAPTNNNAALMRLVLMGPANERRRSEAQVDQDSLADFYEFCDANAYAFNMIRDFQASVWSTCADIASAGRASPALSNGKWAVLIDEPDKPIRQHFTPRNSWGFESAKMLSIRPHAWRVRFVNEDADYKQDEFIVYDDGYNAGNATQFEGLEFPGITNSGLVWKFGRFHIAQLRLRPEEYTFSCDFEHLACMRGDIVLVSHDVTMWGLAWGRVKTLITAGPNITGVVVDEKFPMESGKTYNARFRLEDGTSYTRTLVTVLGEQTTLTFASSTTENILVGDLVIFGEVGTETQRVLIKAVERDKDLVARLVCVDESPAVYTADQGTIPPHDTNISVSSLDVTALQPLPPWVVGVESGTLALVALGSGLVSRILVNVTSAGGTVPVRDYQARYRLLGNSEWSFVTIPVEEATLALWPVLDRELYEYQVRSISYYGVASAWTEVAVERVIGQSESPPDVTNFAVNTVGSQAHLSWTRLTTIDLSHYRVKWSPELSGATWISSVNVANNVSGTSLTLPAQVGTYLIKAVDLTGNESENATLAITNVAKLFGLNVVETLVEQSPTWLGVKDDVYYSAALGGLVLGSSGDLYDAVDLYGIGDLYAWGVLESSGYYYFVSGVDLGGSFTSRLNGHLEASGVNLDLDLYTYVDLYDLVNLYGADESQFDAQLEIRYTEDDPAAAPVWSSWMPFLVGDYTARAYQVRIHLEGSQSVTPIVSYASLVVDMPDRSLRFSANISGGGTRVAFSPAFYAFPDEEGLGISVIDGQEGDKYSITNLDSTGFDIAFTNGGSPVARRISGVAQAYGEVTV